VTAGRRSHCGTIPLGDDARRRRAAAGPTYGKTSAAGLGVTTIVAPRAQRTVLFGRNVSRLAAARSEGACNFYGTKELSRP
jgi:hypothetical protein